MSHDHTWLGAIARSSGFRGLSHPAESMPVSLQRGRELESMHMPMVEAIQKGRCRMTIGEFVVVYERNHVAFLRNRLGTSRRLHTYVGQLVAIPLADLTKCRSSNGFMPSGRRRAAMRRIKRCNNSIRCM